MEVFFGIWGSLFPQYFTNAMLLGDRQVKLTLSIEFTAAFESNSNTDVNYNFESKIKLFSTFIRGNFLGTFVK